MQFVVWLGCSMEADDMVLDLRIHPCTIERTEKKPKKNKLWREIDKVVSSTDTDI